MASKVTRFVAVRLTYCEIYFGNFEKRLPTGKCDCSRVSDGVSGDTCF